MAYLFVYGTLLQTLDNPMSRFLKNQSEFLGKGYIHGKLYDVGAYPAAILSDAKTDKIYGTVLKISDVENTFKVLNTYEGANDLHPLYLKKSVPMYLENGKTLTVWVYVYNHSVSHLKQIQSGDYLNP
tara:strand:+ start:1879 stop:2262 length:384 start_codon:yes stop_codon:yes gene_type:complete